MRQKVALALTVLAIALVGFFAWAWSDDPASPRGEAANAQRPESGLATGATQAPVTATERSRAEAPSGDAAEVAGPPEPRPEELWGRVVIAGTANPIAGAEVQLRQRDADEFTNLDLRYGEQIATLARATSAADGTFRFAVARGKKHRLDVRAAGYAPATAVDCSGGSEVVVGLSVGAIVEGIVRCDGVGLGDVPVRIAVAGESIDLASGRTETGGAFRFVGLQPASVFVQVRSPLHAEEWKRLELKHGAMHRVEIDLKTGVALRGRVVEATTKTPITAAEVSDSWTFKRVVRTGADGTFVVPGLKDGTFVEIHVRAPGFATASRNLAGRLAEEAVFELVRGGEVTGRFVTANGAPAAGVYAAVGASFYEAPGVGGTDWIRADVAADGRFVASGLRPEQHYWLYARGAGFGTRVHALARRLESGERLDVGDVVLHAAGGVEGRVLDDSGQPLEGVAVSIAGANTDSRAWLESGLKPKAVLQFESRNTKTDRRGRFRFTNVAAGNYEVGVRPRAHDETVSVKVDVRDGAITEGVELVVATGGVIEGVVAYADGRKVGDEAAEIAIVAWRNGSTSSSARPDADGRFRLSGLREGAYTVTSLRGPSGWSLSPRPDVATGTTGLQLVFERSSFVSGRVVDADGKPAKAVVYTRTDGATASAAMHGTDADGHFRIEVPPDFQGQVVAQDLQWTLQGTADDVAAGRSELLLQLTKPFGFVRRSR